MDNFNLDLDPKLLMKQNPEFAEFVKDVLFDVLMQDKQIRLVIGSLFAFYQMGMDRAQVAKWLETVRHYQKNDEAE